MLIPHQFIESEKKPQTCSSIPKDKYELQKFIDDKKAYHASELFKENARSDWQDQQADIFRLDSAGSATEDARILDDSADEDDAGRLFGGQIAQSFIIAWISLLVVTLIWRIK